MADRYLRFAGTAPGRFLTRRLGLPQPAPLHRWSPGRPALTRGLLTLTAGKSDLDLSPVLARTGLTESADAPAAVVLDATGVRDVETLAEVHAALHPVVRSVASSGRIVVLGAPLDPTDHHQAAAQQALEGFVRSLGKEIGHGRTVNLIRLTDAPAAESTLHFLLSPRSAYVSGQVIVVGTGAGGAVGPGGEQTATAAPGDQAVAGSRSDRATVENPVAPAGGNPAGQAASGSGVGQVGGGSATGQTTHANTTGQEPGGSPTSQATGESPTGQAPDGCVTDRTTGGSPASQAAVGDPAEQTTHGSATDQATGGSPSRPAAATDPHGRARAVVSGGVSVGEVVVDRDQPLAGRIALVTGAARGIGEAVAEVLARDGAQVVVLDVPQAEEDARRVAERLGGRALALDITAPDAGARIADALPDGLDVLVHNAGITRDRRLVNMPAERWSSVLDVNLASVLRTTDALLDAGTLRRGGRIVATASIAGLAGNAGQTNYGASKAGVVGLVRSLAPRALAEHGVTVNAVAPGFIETTMTAAIPLFIREAGRRMNSLAQGGLPADVAETTAWLAHPASGAVNGQIVRVCGQSLLGA